MDFVDLPGLTLPLDVLALALDLERRDLVLKAKGDVLVVSRKDGSKPTLDEAERAAIKARKPHLLALVAWVSERDSAVDTI